MGAATYPDQLRAAGLRATAARVAVLQVLAEATDHPRVDQVIDRVRRSGVTISTQAAYDVCEALRRGALAQRIEIAGGPARYESRVGDNHHHLACRACGTVVDVDCALGAAPCLTPSATQGFVIDQSEVTHWGLCPTCQPQRREATA